ncbi:Alanine aminotransferase [Entamoeba marina]
MKAFASKSINPNVIATEYAVRGRLVLEANDIEKEIRETSNGKTINPYPFDEVVYCNIGNPQKFNQRPLTYIRQVLSLVEFPDLLETHADWFPADIVNHAKYIIKSIGVKGTTGAYTHSMGVSNFRKSIKEFIERRDDVAANVEDIFITDGASSGIKLILNMLISNSSTGVMIPIPQYPLYSATITQLGGVQVPYYLNEENNWSTDLKSVKEQYDKAVSKGITVKAFVCINPGNPTGQVLTVDNMKEIIEFCYENNICLLADEVYQENIYGDVPFNSFRKVLYSMDEKIKNGVELISFFSVSKGYYGECGKRGGYFQLENINSFARSQMYKMVSVNLCSNVVGQEVVELVCNPPKEGDDSYELYLKEKTTILDSLKRKASVLQKALSECEGVSCNDAMGSMYLFPQITLPQKFIEECASIEEQPDEMYLDLDKKTGTYHYRIAILPPEEQIESVSKQIQNFHKEFLQSYK